MADPNKSHRTSLASRGVFAVFEVSPEQISSAAGLDTERLGRSPVRSQS